MENDHSSQLKTQFEFPDVPDLSGRKALSFKNIETNGKTLILELSRIVYLTNLNPVLNPITANAIVPTNA